MRTTQQFSVTLPRKIAKLVEQKVKSGAYASVSEVMREGVRALAEQDAAVEHWLRTTVATAYDEYKADPTRRITSAQLAKAIKEHRKARAKKKR
jgi:putative addiction module CopG family antidote